MKRPAVWSVGLALVGAQSLQAALAFGGSGTAAPGADRVLIALDAPARPVDVGVGDFTIELWLQAAPGDNNGGAACSAGMDGWIVGHIVVDRDVFGPGDWGDFGLSIAAGRVAFGVADSSSGATACGTTDIRDGVWHHVAATRSVESGALVVWLDGELEAQAIGPVGDVSYRDGRSTAAPADPFLVLGAEKHDAGAEYPSFRGLLAELRVSTTVRYGDTFAVHHAPLIADAATAALYHLVGSTNLVADSAQVPGGPSHGQLAGPPFPIWSVETPFEVVFADGFESGSTRAWSAVVP